MELYFKNRKECIHAGYGSHLKWTWKDILKLLGWVIIIVLIIASVYHLVTRTPQEKIKSPEIIKQEEQLETNIRKVFGDIRKLDKANHDTDASESFLHQLCYRED